MDTEHAQYDDFSATYAEHAAASSFNAFYDRPAILDLAGDVTGKRVLEIGCAAGHLTAELAERGADVLGTDVSAGMIELARDRFGDRATFRVLDVARPLDCLADGSFDLVVASLVLHYLEDWGPTLGEFHRVLRPGGRFVMSTHHPTIDWVLDGRPNYFETQLVTEEWTMGGQKVPVSFYRRPLSATFGALRAAGFAVDRLEEPMPVEECRERDPEAYAKLTSEPAFLFVAATRAG